MGSFLDFIKLKQIIPRRRMYNSILVIIISSTIFVGSLSVIYDLNSVSTDFLGDEENVVVIFNPDASTPFTSMIPEILESSLQGLPGIIQTSPEILQPIVVGDFPIYLRAGRFSSMVAFDETGKLAQEDGPNDIKGTSAIIGENLAKRLGLAIGDRVTLDSIITEKSLDVKVVNILENSFYNDEILVSLPVGRFLSTAQNYQVGHIRVKYDPAVISEKDIFEIALKEYSISLNFFLGNVSNNFKDYVVKIYENESTYPIISSTLKPSMKFFLTPNIYRVEVTKQNGKVVPTNFSQIFGLYSDVAVNVQVQNIRFKKTFATVNHGVPISSLRYVIRSDVDNFEIDGTFNTSGMTDLTLDYGRYNLTVFYLEDTRQYDILVNNTKKEVLDLNIPFRQIRLSDLVNGSVLLEKEFSLLLGPFNYPFRVLLDGIEIFKESGEIGDYLVEVTAGLGNHSLVIENMILNRSVIQWEFTVDDTYSIEVESGIVEYSHYLPGETIGYISRAIRMDSVEISINDKIVEFGLIGDSYQFNLPTTSGFYTIDFRGTTWTNKLVNFQREIIVDNYNKSLGWVAPVEKLPLTNGDTARIWSREPLSIEDQNWVLEREIDNYYRLTPAYTDVNEYLGISSVNFSSGRSLSIYPVLSYWDLVQFVDESGNGIDISGTYQGDLLAVDFDELLLDIDLDTYNASLGNRTVVPIPDTTTQFSFNLTNKVTGGSEIMVIQVIDSTSSSDIPVLKSPVRNRVFSEVVPIQPLTDNITVQIQWTNGTTYYSTTVQADESMGLRIPFGSWILNVSDTSNTTLYAIERLIPSVGNYQTKGEIIQFTQGYYQGTAGETIPLFRSNRYYRDTLTFLGMQSIPSPNFVGYTITNSSLLEVGVGNFTSGIYTIDYLNGTVSSDVLIDLLEIYTNEKEVNIKFEGIDLFNQSFVISENLFLNQPFLIHTYILSDRSGVGLSEGIFEITEVGSQYVHTIEFNSSISEFQIPLLNTSLSYRVYDAAMNPILFDVKNLDSVNHEVRIGDISLNFTYSLPNLNRSGIYSGYVFYKKVGTSLWLDMDMGHNQYLSLAPGQYNFEFRIGEFTVNYTALIEESQTFQIDFPVVTKTLKLILIENPKDSSVEVSVYHPALDRKLVPIKIGSSPNTWVIPDVPLGEVQLYFKGEIIEYLTDFELNSTRVSQYSVYYLDQAAVLQQNLVTGYNKPQLRNGQYGLAQNSDYLNKYLEGSLSIINLILITEVMIVFIISFVNISIFLRSVTEESIQELKIMRSLGYSHFWTFYSFAKGLIAFGIIASLLGQIFAGFLIDFFISSNALIIFGHLFTPEVNQPAIIFGNFIFTILVTLSSAANAYRDLVKI